MNGFEYSKEKEIFEVDEMMNIIRLEERYLMKG
jgi:hypothetical protein